MAWTPMFALPNIHVVKPIEVAHFSLLSATDPRVVDLRRKNENFETYLSHFSTEFQVEAPPSLLMWDDKGPQSYRSTEAISAFRDAIAISVVPYTWSMSIRFQRAETLRFSDWFKIYPWMIDKNFQYVIMQNSNGMGLHDTKLLRGQTTPGLSQRSIGALDIDPAPPSFTPKAMGKTLQRTKGRLG